MDKKIYMKQYRLENKEKIKQQRKQYRLKNKEKINEYNKKYRIENKRYFNNYNQNYNNEYYKNNKDQIKIIKQKYRQTENGKKNKKISDWKLSGLKEYGYTYEEVYEYYLSVNNCEVCKVKLNTNIKTQKCMDHCHHTGCFRWILCQSCNIQDNWINKLF